MRLYSVFGVLVLFASTSAFAQRAAPPPRTNAIWIQQPIAIAAGALSGGFALVPVGLNVDGPQEHPFVIEVTYLHVFRVGQFSASDNLWGAVSVPYQLLGPTRTHGVFFAPKLFAAWSRDHAGAQSFEAQGGADVMLQWTLDELYVATVVGASGGYCFDCFDSAPTSVFGPVTWNASGPRSNHPAFGLNLNLLRVGYAW